MAGQYDPNDPPIRPGFYSIVRAAAASTIKGGNGAAVCIPIVHDWGVEAVATKFTSLAAYERQMGPTVDDAHLAVKGAFVGDGSAEGGASEVWVYRLPLSAADTADVTLDNSASNPALTLVAKHAGTYGNSLNVTVREHPTLAGYAQLLIYAGSTLLETHSYVDTEIDNLADAINSTTTGSQYVVATSLIDAVDLDLVSNVALTGGVTGTAIAGDWTAALSAVEGVAFNIITLPNITDSGILASAVAWCTALNATSRRCMFVEGGAVDELVSQAITRSDSINDASDVVNFGGVTFIDLEDDVTERSTAALTGYAAGIIAGAGVSKSVTFARLPGYKLKARPTGEEVEAAILGGVLICTEDSEGVRIEKQVTVYTVDTDVDKPKSVFSKILSVRILHQIDTDLTVLSEQFWIGEVKNNPNTRDGYIAALKSYFKDLEDAQVVAAGESMVALDENEDNTGDTWYPVYGVTLQQAVERILAVGVVS